MSISCNKTKSLKIIKSTFKLFGQLLLVYVLVRATCGKGGPLMDKIISRLVQVIVPAKHRRILNESAKLLSKNDAYDVYFFDQCRNYAKDRDTSIVNSVTQDPNVVELGLIKVVNLYDR